jgi:uncharacterized protein YlbG (UPF0298 family)
MMNVAINLRSIGYNLTILAEYHALFIRMQSTERTIMEMCEANKIKRVDVFAAQLRHDLKARYKNFLANPELRIKGNPDWDDFIFESMFYFFTWAFIYDTPINLVDIDDFDKVITKGLYVNMTDEDKPDLVEGVDYIKYVKVGGKEYQSTVSTH